jgi:hypothetical protein
MNALQMSAFISRELAVMHRLIIGDASCKEIADSLGNGEVSTWRGLSILKANGLVTPIGRGKAMRWRITDSGRVAIWELIQAFSDNGAESAERKGTR